MKRPLISVIVPIFNVQPYIERCLHSLFQQTLQEIEYIFVNDGSNDNSIEILHKVIKQYPERREFIKIINHEINKGIAAARTSGILAATADYVIHCDPDDYINVSMYETLYNEAIKNKADIIACDLYLESVNKKIEIKPFYGKKPNDILTNKIKDFGKCMSLIDKLVKREIIIKNKIFPYPYCNYAEDMACVIRILYFSKSISKIEIPLYTIYERQGSITRKPLSKDISRQIIQNTLNVSIFLEKHSLRKMSHIIKLNTKINYRNQLTLSFNEWFNLFKESTNKIIFVKTLPLYSRILWWIALQNSFLYKFISRISPSFRL